MPMSAPGRLERCRVRERERCQCCEERVFVGEAGCDDVVGPVAGLPVHPILTRPSGLRPVRNFGAVHDTCCSNLSRNPAQQAGHPTVLSVQFEFGAAVRPPVADVSAIATQRRVECPIAVWCGHGERSVDQRELVGHRDRFVDGESDRVHTGDVTVVERPEHHDDRSVEAAVFIGLRDLDRTGVAGNLDRVAHLEQAARRWHRDLCRRVRSNGVNNGRGEQWCVVQRAIADQHG